jgi:hypothetical protein
LKKLSDGKNMVKAITGGIVEDWLRGLCKIQGAEINIQCVVRHARCTEERESLPRQK